MPVASEKGAGIGFDVNDAEPDADVVRNANSIRRPLSDTLSAGAAIDTRRGAGQRPSLGWLPSRCLTGSSTDSACCFVVCAPAWA